MAIESKKINKFIHQNKYQMPNTELLLDNIALLTKSYKTILPIRIEHTFGQSKSARKKNER